MTCALHCNLISKTRQNDLVKKKNKQKKRIKGGQIKGAGVGGKKGMGTHFSILAWKMLWIKEPGGLQPIG